MGNFFVRSAFTAKTPTGSRMMKKGEALRLSTPQAQPLLNQGLLVDAGTGSDLLESYEGRIEVLKKELGYSSEQAQAEATQMVLSCLRRHEAQKTWKPPTAEFLAEVENFNQNASGSNPVGKETSGKGVGEWAGYRCNIGKGCSHGCLYCYAEKMAVRFNRVENSDEWLEENLRDVSTANCKKYDSPIMFPTSHDITPAYLEAYRCHLFNMLKAGNKVLIVSKPHRKSIEALVSEFSAYRDQITFRFTIGGLDGEAMLLWEPGAPPIEERVDCLKCAFEGGYQTSISAEPMHGGKDEAVKLYHFLAPYITEDIWFGKMNKTGSLRNSENPEVAARAEDLAELQGEDQILHLVETLGPLPKVKWKDSIQEIMNKHQMAKGEKPGQGD